MARIVDREHPNTPRLIALTELLAGWRPGSRDAPWTWDDERADLYESPIHRERTLQLEASILANGIRNPVLLGNDGRVWEGHHRIVIALANEVEMIPYTNADDHH